MSVSELHCILNKEKPAVLYVASLQEQKKILNGQIQKNAVTLKRTIVQG